MKKLLFVILLMGTLACHAQQVIMDKQEANGDRDIATSSVIFTQDKGLLGTGVKYDISMMFSRTKHDSLYSDSYLILLPLKLLTSRSLDVGRKLLLKTQNDSIIELVNTLPIKTTDNAYEIIGHTIVYTLEPYYGAGPSQIQQIINGGIKKLRIELNTGAFDLQPNDKNKFWNFSLAVKMCYDCIQKRLKYNNDLRNGF